MVMLSGITPPLSSLVGIALLSCFSNCVAILPPSTCGVLGESATSPPHPNSRLTHSRCVFAEMFEGRPILEGKTDLNQAQIIFELVGSPNDQNMPGWSQLPGFEGIKEWEPSRGNISNRFRKYVLPHHLVPSSYPSSTNTPITAFTLRLSLCSRSCCGSIGGNASMHWMLSNIHTSRPTPYPHVQKTSLALKSLTSLTVASIMNDAPHSRPLQLAALLEWALTKYGLDPAVTTRTIRTPTIAADLLAIEVLLRHQMGVHQEAMTAAATRHTTPLQPRADALRGKGGRDQKCIRRPA